MKPGGLVLVRDYGIYDHSMIRFEPGHKLDENFYVRQDGTRSYFFSLECVNRLFTDPFGNDDEITLLVDEQMSEAMETGELKMDRSKVAKSRLFEKSISEYVFRETVNVKENLRVPRVFIQSKFVRTHF